MYCLTDTCFLCLKNNIKIKSVLIEDTDGIVVNEKLKCFFPEIIDSTPDAHKFACLDCLEKLRFAYDFRQSVIRNNTVFRDYIHKLKCRHKSYQQLLVLLPRSKHPFTKDFTTKKHKKCAEKHDTNNLKCQNKNFNLTCTNQEQQDTQDQSTHENDVFTKFSSKIKEIYFKTENLVTDEIHIKDEPQVDDDFSTNYLDEESNEFSQLNINENETVFTKFSCETDEINLKTENLETEEVHIKEEPVVDDFSTNYLEEESKESEATIYECQICHLGFNNPIYFENHANHCNNKIQKPEKIVTTKIGDDIVSNLNNSSNSTPSTTNNEDVKKRYKCKLCPKAYNIPSKLEIHCRTHTGERPYICQICQKAFTLPHHLERHKVTHTGEKPFNCDVCQKWFGTKSNLLAHKRTHNKIRPYKCSLCPKTFSQTSYRQKHMYFHTGFKPYHCHMCEYKCALNGDLKKHIRTHIKRQMKNIEQECLNK